MPSMAHFRVSYILPTWVFDSVLFIAKVVEDLENEQADGKHLVFLYVVQANHSLNTAVGCMAVVCIIYHAEVADKDHRQFDRYCFQPTILV